MRSYNKYIEAILNNPEWIRSLEKTNGPVDVASMVTFTIKLHKDFEERFNRMEKEERWRKLAGKCRYFLSTPAAPITKGFNSILNIYIGLMGGDVQELAEFKKLDAPNGWGKVEDAIRFLEDWLAICKQHSKMTIRVSR